ncbi:hypothetical protein [Pseudomonas typographi]|nr:hypothetical protein [Pseudomonas typographi]
MSTEKMREEFEAWVEANFGLSVRRNPAGTYQSFCCRGGSSFQME